MAAEPQGSHEEAWLAAVAEQETSETSAAVGPGELEDDAGVHRAGDGTQVRGGR